VSKSLYRYRVTVQIVVFANTTRVSAHCLSDSGVYSSLGNRDKIPLCPKGPSFRRLVENPLTDQSAEIPVFSNLTILTRKAKPPRKTFLTKTVPWKRFNQDKASLWDLILTAIPQLYQLRIKSILLRIMTDPRKILGWNDCGELQYCGKTVLGPGPLPRCATAPLRCCAVATLRRCDVAP
jgi:hypothetical protein